MLEERGVFLDHTTIFRWVIRFTPFLLSAFQKKKRPVGDRWRMDETYVKVNGNDRYLYRAVDKEGQTVEFLLTSCPSSNYNFGRSPSDFVYLKSDHFEAL